MALTQKELRHLKGSCLTSGKKSCVVKGSSNLSGPQPDGKLEAEAEEKRRLTMQTQGRPKEPLVGPQSIPIKEKLVRIDKLDFSLFEIRANNPG
jgi:hypothetical protein